MLDVYISNEKLDLMTYLSGPVVSSAGYLLAGTLGECLPVITDRSPHLNHNRNHDIITPQYTVNRH